MPTSKCETKYDLGFWKIKDKTQITPIADWSVSAWMNFLNWRKWAFVSEKKKQVSSVEWLPNRVFVLGSYSEGVSYCHIFVWFSFKHDITQLIKPLFELQYIHIISIEIQTKRIFFRVPIRFIIWQRVFGTVRKLWLNVLCKLLFNHSSFFWKIHSFGKEKSIHPYTKLLF